MCTCSLHFMYRWELLVVPLFLIRNTDAQALAGTERVTCANAAFALLCSSVPFALLGFAMWVHALCTTGAVEN